MVQLIELTLENEMDLILAHRRAMAVGERLGLTIATQTTFATAVSEISRSVIEHTDQGRLVIGIQQQKQRYALRVLVTYDSQINLTNADEGFYYAQRLIPEFNLSETDGLTQVEMKIGLPRSLDLNRGRIAALQQFFANGAPINAYEEIKNKNLSLSRIKEKQEEEIRQSKLINEKRVEFISIASHEIKTPITIIKALTQLAKGAREECSDKVFKLIDKIDTQTTKLVTLVQQLMDVSRIENGSLIYSMERITLRTFLGEMVQVMQHAWPEHEVLADMEGDFEAVIDRLRMEQVFSNLLGNAAKYSAKGSQIIISCRKNAAGFAEIEVADQGIGMSPEDTRLVFDKFFRVKDIEKTHPGLGMGLYITSKIIVDHGGQIRVNSELGKGSSFVFTIPLVSQQPSVGSSINQLTS